MVLTCFLSFYCVCIGRYKTCVCTGMHKTYISVYIYIFFSKNDYEHLYQEDTGAREMVQTLWAWTVFDKSHKCVSSSETVLGTQPAPNKSYRALCWDTGQWFEINRRVYLGICPRPTSITCTHVNPFENNQPSPPPWRGEQCSCFKQAHYYLLWAL